MACETHAPLFWESEPLSTLAHKPLPNSNSAILTPSICFISELHVGLTIPIYPKCSLRAALFHPGRWNEALIDLYARLIAKGRVHNAALVACARKLLIYANTIVRRGTPWTEKAAWRLMVATGCRAS